MHAEIGKKQTLKLIPPAKNTNIGNFNEYLEELSPITR